MSTAVLQPSADPTTKDLDGSGLGVTDLVDGTDITEPEPVEQTDTTDDTTVANPTGHDAADDDAELPPLVTAYLDARELVDDPKNLRKNLRASLGLTPEPLADDPDIEELRTLVDGDLEDLPASVRQLAELKASINEVGILQPLVVVPAPDHDGAWQIVIGHRRKYASILVRKFRVPCILATDYDEVKRILAQLAENVHRVGLTASEEAEAFEQLTLLDWTTERIAAVRGVPEETVVRSLRLRRLPKAVAAALDSGQLSLDEIDDNIEALGDHPTALAKVLNAQAGWSRKHTLAGELAKIASAKAKELAKAKLVIDGVTVTSKPAGFGYTSTATDVRQLIDGDGNRLDPDKVKTLPGFAAFVEKVGSGADTLVYCTDPAKYGYTKFKPTYGRQLTDEEIAAQVEAEQARAAFLEALEAAEGLRRKHILATYGPAKGAKRLFLAALRQDLIRVHQISFADVDGLYANLGGSSDDVLRTAGEDRLRRSCVARWICAQERNLARATDSQGWGFDRTAVVDWYAQLVEDGYGLADAEQQLLDSFTRTTGDEDYEDYEDEADGDGQQSGSPDQETDEDLADAVADLAVSPAHTKGPTPSDTGDVAGSNAAGSDPDQPTVEHSEDPTEDLGADAGEDLGQEPDELVEPKLTAAG
ncbi:ParB/RepB/Spo0J family partition protein [Dactylosporangium sp. NPDC005572]|uniref:ParB/RepB/Spo0J family partition protein n=1 Tax=Dactylosporangium sp. NPDC005572 TaxID=3156889 RepID=UPI0033A1C5DD